MTVALCAFILSCLNNPTREPAQGNPGRDTLAVKVCPYPQAGPIDMFDPQYRVIRPNGGEIFYVGEQCTVVVHSAVAANAVLSLRIAGGHYSYPLRGAMGTINPYIDTMIVFTAQDTFVVRDTIKTCMISDSCYIALTDYEVSVNGYRDYSDCYFAIRRRP
jgi:hypothetical protein